MTTREAARPLRRYLRARVQSASLPQSYTITRDTTASLRFPLLPIATARANASAISDARAFLEILAFGLIGIAPSHCRRYKQFLSVFIVEILLLFQDIVA
jgi:hypothetical protein